MNVLSRLSVLYSNFQLIVDWLSAEKYIGILACVIRMYTSAWIALVFMAWVYTNVSENKTVQVWVYTTNWIKIIFPVSVYTDVFDELSYPAWV